MTEESTQSSVPMNSNIVLSPHQDLKSQWTRRARKHAEEGREDQAAHATGAALHHSIAEHHAAAGAHQAQAAAHIADAASAERDADQLGAPRARQSDDAQAFIRDSLRDPSLIEDLVQSLGEESTDEFLTRNNYNTSAEEIFTAFQAARESKIQLWTGQYNRTLISQNGERFKAPTLIINGSEVTLGERALKRYQFENFQLSWRAEDGNSTSGSLRFEAIATVDGDIFNSFEGQLSAAERSGRYRFAGQTGTVSETSRQRRSTGR